MAVQRENKMVGSCYWRLSTLSEDPILRIKGWITLNHKDTTGKYSLTRSGIPLINSNIST